jgi:hypothetical protein
MTVRRQVRHFAAVPSIYPFSAVRDRRLFAEACFAVRIVLRNLNWYQHRYAL